MNTNCCVTSSVCLSVKFHALHCRVTSQIQASKQSLLSMVVRVAAAAAVVVLHVRAHRAPVLHVLALRVRAAAVQRAAGLLKTVVPVKTVQPARVLLMQASVAAVLRAAATSKLPRSQTKPPLPAVFFRLIFTVQD